MLSIIVTWLLLFLLFAGAGMLVLPRLESVTLAFWAGWGITIGVLQVWSLVFPVNDAARLLVVVLAVGGWLRYGRPEINFTRGGLIALAGFAVFVLWLANRSITAPNAVYDTGLYHLNAVRWSAEYPMVPGLGLLHSRLAFSNAYFLYPALLDYGPWAGRTYHIANGLLMGALALHGLVIGLRHQRNAYGLFHLLLLPVIAFLLLTNNTVPTISNDPAVFALGMVVAGQVLWLLLNASEAPGAEGRLRLLLLVLLCAVGIAVKYSFGVYGVGMALLAWGVYAWMYVIQRRRRPWGMTVLLGLVAAFVLLPMMARSVIATGYPLYPVTAAAFDVDWRIPAAAAQRDSEIIRAWALDPTRPAAAVLADWAWLGGWLGDLARQYFHIGLAGMLAVGSALLLIVRRRRFRWWLLLFALPALAGLVFWFVTVPNIRFALLPIWALALGLTALALHTLETWRRAALLVIIGVLLLPSARLLLLDPWVAPGPEDGLYPITEPDLERFTTNSGLELWIPADGGEQCWDSPLPCMAFPSADLALREPGDLRQGFTTQSRLSSQ